jgi:uncharacterized surface protein with fasciclin (FAS1) repeats
LQDFAEQSTKYGHSSFLAPALLYRRSSAEKIKGGKRMKNTKSAMGALVLGLGIFLAGSARAEYMPEKDIVDTAVSAGSFNTLVTAIKAAGLVETLKGDGPFTVFAPTDDAFAKLPEGTVENLLKPENREQLVAILTYHVVAGKVTAEQVVDLSSAKTANGKDLKIDANNGKVMVDNANVIKTDIMASNGVIHVIDAVVLP